MAKTDFCCFLQKNLTKFCLILKLKIKNEIKSQNKKKWEKFQNTLNKNKHCAELKTGKANNIVLI